MAGIQEATQMVTSYFDPATKLIYAIGAVIGLIGGVQFGRSGYVENRCELVRSLYLPDRRRHDSAFVFPLDDGRISDQ